MRGENAGAANLLYIAASGRSGSSLLDIVLGSHPDMMSTGEVHRLSLNPESRTCPCGATIEHCPYWTEVRYALSVRLGKNISAWSEFPVSNALQTSAKVDRFLSQLVLYAGNRRLSHSLGRTLAHLQGEMAAADNSWLLFDSIVGIAGASYAVDSTKSPVRMKALYMSRPRRTKVLHLIRDGRAVAASSMRRTGQSIEAASNAWVQANKNIDRMLRSLPEEAVLMVRYEDFCDQPVEWMNRIFDHVGVARMSSVRIPDLGEHHAIPGNPILLQQVGDVTKDDRWRTELTSRDLDAYAKVAGAYAHGKGYSEAQE